MNPHVLSALFDLVDLPTLCASSRVSRLWREVARDHPAYWKHLSLNSQQMSAADVVLFLDRLGAKVSPDAAVRLFLRFPHSTSPINRLVVASIVVPLVKHHMYRVEELILFVSPTFSDAIWPLFASDAPRLSELQVIIDGYAGGLPPVPSLFNTSAHTCLEYLILRNVPLPSLVQPLTHTLKLLRAEYTFEYDSMDSPFERVLSWFPSSQTLDLLPLYRGYRRRIQRLPDLSDAQLRVIQHLVIRHQRHLLGIPHTHIPIMSICAPMERPGRIRQLVPETGMLAVVFRVRMGRSLRYAMDGRVVVATVDGTRIREFRGLRVGYLQSPSFMEEIILSNRLVSLTTSLAIGFRTLCEHAYYLPRLQSLRLILNNLPDPVSDWCTRAVVCPMLSSLTFQREVELIDAYISRPALEAFVRMAITMDAPETLRIILEDIPFVGGELGMTVECRPAKMCWTTVHVYSGAKPHWIYKHPECFGLKTPMIGN